MAYPNRRVAILGGGIGGLSAAHELVKHGFEVDVYEASSTLGGKAKSQYLPGTGRDGQRDLPGEHGFRFYPHFYTQLIWTFAEIPDPKSPTGFVEGNLVGTSEAGIGLGQDGLIVGSVKVFDGLRVLREAGISPLEIARYLWPHAIFATASDKRRLYEYDELAWWSFVDADDENTYSAKYKEIIAATTRTLIAMDAHNGSARSVGLPSLLLLFAGRVNSSSIDRTMAGPTTDCLIDPWQRHLEKQGVRFHFDVSVEHLHVEDGRIASVELVGSQSVGSQSDRRLTVEADEYVLATPLEVAHSLIGPELQELDPHLQALAGLDPADNTDWMSGAQYFLSRDVPICSGHIFCVDTPWGITAISQGQFWGRGERGVETYGDGTVKGIISVDIANFWAEDEQGRRAVECTSADEFLDCVWEQLLRSVGDTERRSLEEALVGRHLDTNLRFTDQGVVNTTPLFVHVPGRFMDRPPAALAVPNLCLAGDYVRTNVDLASMEGANEAGRRASRAIIARAGLDPELVRVADFRMPWPVRFLQRLDERLFDAGRPHFLSGFGEWVASLRRGRRTHDEQRLARVEQTLSGLLEHRRRAMTG